MLIKLWEFMRRRPSTKSQTGMLNGMRPESLELYEEEENDVFHENQIGSRLMVRHKLKEYVDTLTVHGLTRVLSGTKREKCFWLFMVLGGLALALFVIQGLVLKYLERNVYVEINSELVNEKRFPSLTICNENKLMKSYFSYCGFFSNDKSLNKSCTLDDIWKQKTKKKRIKQIKENNTWSNGLFTVHKCETWDGKICLNDMFLRSLEKYNGACFTWNYNGNLTGFYGHTEILFSTDNNSHRKERYFVIAHDPNITEIDLTKQIILEPQKSLSMVVEMTFVKRLPAPFPSKCEIITNENDIFPGGYSRRTCIESQFSINLYRSCGDAYDYVRPYIPDEIKAKYYRNRSIHEVLNCFRNFTYEFSHSLPVCPFPCDEIELTSLNNFNNLLIEENHLAETLKIQNKTLYKIDFQYQRVDSYRRIEEKELYTLYQMLCEIGGFVGLVLGASILSFVEILTMITLYIYEKFTFKNKI